jgi:hypothetical protein
VEKFPWYLLLAAAIYADKVYFFSTERLNRQHSAVKDFQGSHTQRPSRGKVSVMRSGTHSVEQQRGECVQEECDHRERVRPRQVIVVGVHEPVAAPAFTAEDRDRQEQQRGYREMRENYTMSAVPNSISNSLSKRRGHLFYLQHLYSIE